MRSAGEDPADDEGGGVYVRWNPSPHLSARAVVALRRRHTSSAVLRHHGAVMHAMAQAIAAILTSAGFSAGDASDEYRPYELRVHTGPGQDVTAPWASTEVEVTIPARGHHPG
jgi:hypothetical protein